MENTDIEIVSTEEHMKSLFFEELKMILSELSFTFLPFLVLLIVNYSKENFDEFMKSSDWSLATAVLFGQTIVKLVIGISTSRKQLPSEKYGLITAIIIVIGLIPSIVLLIIFQFDKQGKEELIVMQFILFASSVITFILFGTIGNMLKSDGDKNNHIDSVITYIKSRKKNINN